MLSPATKEILPKWLAQFSLLGLALLTGWMSSQYSFSMVPMIIAGILGSLVLIVVTFQDPFQGFLLNLIVSFFLFLPQRIMHLSFSLAALWEAQVILCFFAVLVRNKGKYKTDRLFWKNPVTWLVLIYLLFIILEAANPNVPDRRGWLFSFRRTVPFTFTFLSAYFILDRLERISQYFRALIILIFLATAYAYYQQFVGLPSFDLDYLYQPGFYERMYVWGVLRKFSFLDVVTFPILANIGALILIIFIFFESRPWRVIGYLLLTVFMLVGSVFAGTRSANFLVPAGLLLYSVVNIRKPRAILFYAGLIAAIFILISLPIYRFTELNRFRSAFQGGDASLEVRNINRMFIQPYIHEHPIGGGSGSAGLAGGELYPNHPLADFPPDSGHLLSALEKGWIGFGLDMLLYLFILTEGIKGLFRTSRREHKKYYMAIICSVFSLVVAEYAQIVVTQIPICGVFFSFAAITVRLRQIDSTPETLSI